MTRDEFIDQYMKGRGIDPSAQTPDGFALRYGDGSVWRRVALPCACGDPSCNGWAMITDDQEQIEDHNRFYAPGGEFAA